MIELGPNHYGKEAIRLVKLVRAPDRHQVRDLTVGVELTGEFEAAHTAGDNSMVLATDTMKNTVYAFAKDHLTGSIEAFGLELTRHFSDLPQVLRATVRVREHTWQPINAPGVRPVAAFSRSGELTRSAAVSSEADADRVTAGIEGLIVMKTARSAFTGFPRDRFTTLAETGDRIMATQVSASWRYPDGATGLDFDGLFEGVRTTLLETFAAHDSRSVQESMWLIGRAILERHPELVDVTLTMPNLHHWKVDLSPFGMANDNEVFVATTEPHGLIEATIVRSAD
jgi:urate oxidase